MKLPSLKFHLFLLFTFSAAFSPLPAQESAKQPKPLRALLIAGGCCHDYARQQEALCKGIQSRANVQVDVYWTDNSSTAPVLPLYGDANWAEKYDVIIHDECAADIKDQAIVDRILQTHQKIPAVHLHCAMHSFRTGTDAWFKHLGLQSTGHGPQEPIDIEFVDKESPITATLSNWTTIKEELYNNVKLFGARPLAIGKQVVGQGEKKRTEQAVVAWTNETQGARSFSTTIGHNTETVADPRYLELVTRGLLWACNKLSPEYLQPYAGENKVTFIDGKTVQAALPESLGNVPANATLVRVTASSTQAGNETYRAIDGNSETRWCAEDGAYPQWLQLEFEKPQVFQEVQIQWEFPGRVYQYRIEGSSDGKSWNTLLDQSKNASDKQLAEALPVSDPMKFLRVYGLGSAAGWCSIRELKVKGKDLGTLWPADTKVKQKFVPVRSDPYTNQGNVPPTIVKLSPEEEAQILKDVKIPDGFEATLFASPPAVNYPVFVAADPYGTLYVSSDGNGSLGRSAKRGRVIRLRDLDGDGRADETKIFCEVDAPRGLVWDHDRLYLMHPPHLSAFIDRDGDGVAEEQQVLVKNLAFGYDKRPADHTTNGVSIGADGWLYIAGGDFGFMDAEGTDGRKVTHRGGGVIRVRPDGTGLEVYSTGTRNILEVAISPQMDMFARDNTNDGGGWNVRMHHFTGMDDHGYPRLYLNFADECVPPLADYGGGSGCGAVFIDEPGFGDWNNAPFTADWGTGALYRHTVSPKGATFEESSKPEPFIRMTRPTDADVDGNSRVYCASWRGATFNWEGPDVGYIVCVKPKDFKPAPAIDFVKATEEQLIATLESPSYRRRLEAQRELTRRKNPAAGQLLERSVAQRSPARNLAERLQNVASDGELVKALADTDPVIVHIAQRSLAQRKAFAPCFQALDDGSVPPANVLRALAKIHDPSVVAGLIQRLSAAKNAAVRQEILAALCRLHFVEGEWKGDSWGTRPDTRGPYYQPETWSESARIAQVLQAELEQSTPENAASLLLLMDRNRVQSDSGLERLLVLAENHDNVVAAAVARLANLPQVPTQGVKVLVKAANQKDALPTTLAQVVTSLAKVPSPDAPAAMLKALAVLESNPDAKQQWNKAVDAFSNSPHLQNFVSLFHEQANQTNSPESIGAEMALLVIASSNDASPEAREIAQKSLDTAWEQPSRRERLMLNAGKLNNHYLDEKILKAREDQNAEIAKVARKVAEQLKIADRAPDKTPSVSSLPADDVISQVVKMTGNASVGQQVFTRANCTACHTVRQDQVQKGPFLGNIAKTYKRPDLATAILVPNKTIAQGFVTNAILNTDGVLLTGFVTNELSDRVTIRDQQGKEFTIAKDDIEERKTLPTSVMPSELMNQFTLYELASLLDYLESLAK